MRIATPFREPGQELEDSIAVGMKDMRTVGMDDNPMRVDGVVRVARDVRASVDEVNAVSGISQRTRQGSAREPDTDHQDIDLHRACAVVHSHPFSTEERQSAVVKSKLT